LENSWNADIGQYLPEAAWQVADEKKLCITLHMVKDRALADPDNLRYITEMAKAYPNATLILAHAARSFAAWTGIETVEKVAHLDNVWFDLSAVCESPAMMQIIKKTGTQRTMWGSDYTVSRYCGKAISLGDSFYWIYKKDLEAFSGATSFSSWLVGIENLMATRQACMLLDLDRKAVEDLFYGNAARLFRGE
jgi:glutamate-1-semialdehyde 2,1-aminomutase